MEENSPITGNVYRYGGWISWGDNTWVQVQVSTTLTVLGVVTQGNQYVDAWTSQYSVAYLNDSSGEYVNITKVFTGNSDRFSLVFNYFDEPITTTSLRIYPKLGGELEVAGQAVYGLRFDLITCSSDIGLSLCMDPLQVKTYSSSHTDDIRPLYPNIEGVWGTTSHPTYQQWIRISLANTKVVTAIKTRGYKWQFIRSYYLHYLPEGWDVWVPVTNSSSDGTQAHVMRGNHDGMSWHIEYLPQPIVTSSITLYTLEFVGRPALKLDILGCERTDYTCSTLDLSESYWTYTNLTTRDSAVPFSYTTTTSYFCQENKHRYRGANDFRCRANRRYSGYPLPGQTICREGECTSDFLHGLESSNVRLLTFDVAQGSVLKVECLKGYILKSGNLMRTCNKMVWNSYSNETILEWDGEQALCEVYIDVVEEYWKKVSITLGSILLIIGCFASILWHVCAADFTDSRLMQLSLEICLIIGYFTWIYPGPRAIDDEVACKVFAFTNQYIFAVAFTWTMFLGVHVNALMTGLIPSNVAVKLWLAVILSWLLPGVLLVAPFGYTHYSDYGGDGASCLLRMFSLPHLITLLYNTLCLVVSFVMVESATQTFMQSQLDNINIQQLNNARIMRLAYLIIPPLLYVCWNGGYLAITYDHLTGQSITAILTALLGAFIFLLHALAKKCLLWCGCIRMTGDGIDWDAIREKYSK